MSTEELVAAIQQMEAWVADPNWVPEPERLLRWNEEFQAARTQVKETTLGWVDLVARAHALGERVEAHTALLSKQQDDMKAELDAQALGNRALRGYGSSTR